MVKLKNILKEVQAQNIKQDINTFLKEYQISSCAAYVYKDGKPLFEYYKNANENSVFGIGSVSKGIDKIAVMKLVEDGRLKLSDPLFKFGFDMPKDGINLVNYYNWEHWESITIEHLMNHTSGIPDLINDIPEFNFHYGEFGKDPDPDDLTILRALAKYPLYFEPGTKETYSNSNFWFLCKVIEKVTGKTYGDAMKELVFEPLDMENTYWAYENTKPAGLVPGTVLDVETNKLLPPFPIKPFDAYAIFYSSPADMLKLGNAYINDELISEKTRKSFFFPEPDNSPGQVGAIHDGYTCRWDAYANKKVVILFVVNQFGQTVSDPVMEMSAKMRDSIAPIS